MKVFLVDNYDSFTYNLAQAFGKLGAEVRVERNDAVSAEDILTWGPTHLVISPGPGDPTGAGVSMAAIAACAGRLPVLGVCLGHQAIGHVFGGKVVRAPRVMHGKTSEIRHDGRGIFQGLPIPMLAARYHSLVIDRGALPACLELSGESSDGEVMAVRHRTLEVDGVQFHPESFLTLAGERLLGNFLLRRR